MPSRAEIKTTVQGLTSLAVFEGYNRIRPIKLQRIDNASWDLANNLATSGKWQEAASYYHTLMERSFGIHEKADAAINLSQMLINLGRFGQTREILGKITPEVFTMGPEDSRWLTMAKISEKLAWISDYGGLFKESIKHLEDAERHISLVSEDYLKDEVDSLKSTITHFKGRAWLGISFQLEGEDKRKAIEGALHYFQLDLDRFEKMREEGNPAPANEGFQHAWIARCYLEIGALDVAESSIELVGGFFKEFVETENKINKDNKDYQESGILGHYYQLKGGLEMKRGNMKVARNYFEKALTEWYTKTRYPKGEASALFGIAASYWADKKVWAAIPYAVQAVSKYPHILIRPTI